MPTFEQLFTEHVGAALGRQLALADVLGDRDWHLDLGSGRATFGRDLTFSVQLLGTEATEDQTWLWAWANEESALPPALLRVAGELRALGERQRIELLAAPSFPTVAITGHEIAMVASGLAGGLPYYRGPYEGGAVFFVLENGPPAIWGPYGTERVVTVLMQAISGFALDHRAMSRAFLGTQHFRIQESADRWTAQAGDGRQLEIAFDGLGRIANVTALAGAHLPGGS